MAKPDLVVRADDLTVTARELVRLFALTGRFFDRAGPVKIIASTNGSLPKAEHLTAEHVVIEAHALARPVVRNSVGEIMARTLPDRVARLYLAMGDCCLLPLNGITGAPLLSADGTVRTTEGYDALSGMWCANVPAINVRETPSRDEAGMALALIREYFQTFPFADVRITKELRPGVPVIDLSAPPAFDESALIAALLTAICRPSLRLAPGLLISAPSLSGAGTGKGLLVRAICMIAFGIEPRAFNAGHGDAELEKRLGAALMEATPVLFIDNVNSTSLRSDLLASVLTETVVDVRLLGASRMMRLNPAAFVAVTGNGVMLSEDLTRRFIVCELDAHTEDPERRPFAPGFLDGIKTRRYELLTAALTIWRWGRFNESDLPHGRPLGSFETWCRWVRDPLLALGCADPVERSAALKARDPIRGRTAELYAEWWRHHGDRAMKLTSLDVRVRSIIDPHDRGRQYVAVAIGRLVGTRAAGYVLTRQDAAGKWGVATYALRRTDAADDGQPGTVPWSP